MIIKGSNIVHCNLNDTECMTGFKGKEDRIHVERIRKRTLNETLIKIKFTDLADDAICEMTYGKEMEKICVRNENEICVRNEN